MSDEWTTVRIRKMLLNAVQKIVDSEVKSETGLAKWKSIPDFIEEACDEKINRIQKEARKQ